MTLSIDPVTQRVVLTHSVGTGLYQLELDYFQTLGLIARLEALAQRIEPQAPLGKIYEPRWS